MDPLAFTTKGWNVPSNRWIVNLSNGQVVFEDNRPGHDSAWIRLKKYVKENNLHITNIRLPAYGKNISVVPYRDNNGNPQISGYWHLKRSNSVLSLNSDVCVPATVDHGIGYILNNQIHIVWLCGDQTVKHEIRNAKNDLGCIYNH